jgi:hypothetical protein
MDPAALARGTAVPERLVEDLEFDEELPDLTLSGANFYTLDRDRCNSYTAEEVLDAAADLGDPS